MNDHRVHFCRVCGGQVLSPDAWVLLDRLGKFWLCPTHMADATFLWTEDVGFVYVGGGQRFVIGPYRYDKTA